VQENNKNNLTALITQKFIIADASADIVITMINCPSGNKYPQNQILKY
jgi:hypothetical protein